MSDPLRRHRLDGSTPTLGCIGCPFLKTCGGNTRASGWSCLDACDNCDVNVCDKVCFSKPGRLGQDLLEIDGFEFKKCARLTNQELSLPSYIPVVNQSIPGLRNLLSSETRPVAIPIEIAMRLARKHAQGEISTVWEALDIPTQMPVLISGIAKDEVIEAYWSRKTIEELPERFLDLGISGGIVPNYSLFLNEPRTQHLHNRKRVSLVAEHWANVGLSAIPVLQALTEADWGFWLRYLESHPKIRYVAVEFQTGRRRRGRLEFTVEKLVELQRKLGRKIHVVSVGLNRPRALALGRFENWSILNSSPFHSALHRTLFRLGQRGIVRQRSLQHSKAQIAKTNIDVYRRHMARVQNSRLANEC